MHDPGTSHWAQLAANIRVDNKTIVLVVLIIAIMVQ